MRNRKVIEELGKYLFIFDEGYGTAYERYALNRFISQLVKKYDILKVLELPANGVMGIPGIKSLIFAELGCEVTVAHPSRVFLETAKGIWDVLGLDAHFIKSNWINSEFGDNTFDLVWNFCVFEHFYDPKRVIQEMVRVTRRYLFIEIQNILNPGFPLHRFYHWVRREPWDHGSPSKMKLSSITTIINELNATTVETGATDMPPWPDINIKVTEMASKKASVPIWNDETEITCDLRPAVKIKPLPSIINDIRKFEKCSGKEEIILQLFLLWYHLVESKAPHSIKKFLAHHPYVLAEKRSSKWR
ncbi:MAG: class I SAM-dependent methyltransferase [Methanophagales archaeon ANME-1-THS]|nr:MAG: class I SAM-dependent methyltransferase [Methanophagales archaeon ANME-1-THS]